LLWLIVLVLDGIARSTLHPDDRETIAETPLRHGFDRSRSAMMSANAQRLHSYIPFTTSLRIGN